MIDWQGLLKFSIQHTDGTKKSQFKQMPEQDKQWLEEAMKHYCNSEIQRIKTLLEELSKQQTENSQQSRLSLLEELQEILDSLDKGITLYKIGGHIILLKIVFFSKFESNKIVALQIFASLNQNDSYVQTESINTGALQLVDKIISQKSIRLRENMMSAISSILRGQNLEAKRIFIKIKGTKMIQRLLKDKQTECSKRLAHKIYILLRDLLYYDDKLHFTYNDLSSFSNTANIELEEKSQKKQGKKDSLTYDKNKQIVNNELEQNKQFRGYFHDWLAENKQISQTYDCWLKEQKKLQEN